MSSKPLSNLPPRRPIVRERSYPLVALLQFATVWAAMFACVDGERLLQGLRSDAWQVFPAGIALAVFVGVGAAIGGTIGLSQVRMWRGAIAGAAAGSIYGIAIFSVYAAPAGYERSISSAAVLMLTTIAFRYRAD